MTAERLRYKVYISLLTSLAIVIHALESSIPTPFPWLKFGFANIITLAAIIVFGFRAGLTVTILRVFVGTFIMGTFLTPAFFLAISGGVASTIVLAATYRYLHPVLSIIGISVLGAFTHTAVQIIVVYLLLVRHFQIFMLLPVFLTFSVLAGIINGLGADFFVRHLRELPKIREVAEANNL